MSRGTKEQKHAASQDGGCPKSASFGAYTPAVPRRGGQVEVVSPILFRQHSTAHLSRRSQDALHPAVTGLLLGVGRFTISAGILLGTVPDSPCPAAVSFLLRCSGSHRAGLGPLPCVLGVGTFLSDPNLAIHDHRQLPTSSWRGPPRVPPPMTLPVPREDRHSLAILF